MSLKSGYEKTKETNKSQEDITVNKKLAKNLSKILELVLEQNKNSENYKEKLISLRNMSFTSLHRPQISIEQYLERIIYYSDAEESTFIIALIYMDRLNVISGVILTPYNIHKILFIAILLAIKFNEDSIYEFEYYSQIAGITVKELKILEFEFVCLLKFKLFINKKEFDSFKSSFDKIDCKEENDD